MTLLAVLGTVGSNDQFTSTTPTQLNSTQLLSQASKQRVVCAQQRDVIMLMTSLHCRPQLRWLSWVELRRWCKLAITEKFINQTRTRPATGQTARV